MIHSKRWSGMLAVAGLVAAGAANAGTATNTMTNIVTVTDVCDIVAIGVDFGITTVPIAASGLVSVNPNTTTGNAVTGNTANPDAAKDGGASNDDVLQLTTPDSTLNTALAPLVSAVSTTAPGIYVACTTTPSSISLLSAAAGAASYALPVTLGASPTGTYSGTMSGIGGGASSSNQIAYTMTFVGAPTSTVVTGTVNLFLGSFVATGTIPSAQSGTIVPGYYADVATATVNF